MEDLGKLAAAAVLGTLLALTVRKQNPDLALLVVLAAGTVLLSAALQYMQVIEAFRQDLSAAAGLQDDVIGPLFRAVGICVLVHAAACVCRDSAESALAAKLELCGNAACIVILLPLLSRLIRLIAGIV